MTTTASILLSRRTALLAIAGATAQLMTGCGGGGDSSQAGLSSGGTGSFTTGTVSGLGSIIVNGIRYDDSRATVYARDDDDTPVAVQVGMVVVVQGGKVTPAANANTLPTATATSITVGSEWKGPVEAVDTTQQTLTVLGQTVQLLATTVITGNVLRLADITTSMYVEVYGYLDATTGALQATRVETDDSAPSTYRLTGVVANLDTTGRTFAIGNALISYGGGVSLPANWANGLQVRVRMSTTLQSGRWPATRIQAFESALAGADDADGDEAELHGIVSSFQSVASFMVNGIPVNASSASVNGTLAAGVNVEVKGRVSSGVIVATEVEVKDETEIENEDFEFHGTLSGVDTTARTFVLRGYTFSYDNETVFDGLTLSNSSTDLVEVKARIVDGAWLAVEVERED